MGDDFRGRTGVTATRCASRLGQSQSSGQGEAAHIARLASGSAEAKAGDHAAPPWLCLQYSVNPRGLGALTCSYMVLANPASASDWLSFKCAVTESSAPLA